MAQTFSIRNAGKPAPKWYRITKRIIYLVTSGAILGGTLTHFGMSDAIQVLVTGWILMIGEILTIIMAESQYDVEAAKPEVQNENV